MEQGHPQIPTRLSSKQAEIRKADIEEQKRKLEDDIVNMNKRLKKHHSFDVSIWASLREIDSARTKANGLQRKISMLSMDLNDESKELVERWASTAEAKAILEQEAALKKSLVMMTRQSEKVANHPKDKETQDRKTWTQLFINARLGMNVIKPSQSRSNERQKQFGKKLIEVMNAKFPEASSAEYLFWCPVIGDWCSKVEAGHLFPSKSGDELMKAIFGEAEQDLWIGKPEKGKGELFRACNGILWSEQAEYRFSKGLFTIVPDLDENPSLAQSSAWQRSDPKVYRIRVLRADNADMKARIKAESNVRWTDLDNKRLQWRSNFRPWARYLYWSYCEMMLRQAYGPRSNMDAADVRRQEVGKKYWGSAGPYMKKNMLLGFVEEMGHEYEHLMEGAMDADDNDDGGDDGDKPTAVAVMHANESILEKRAIIEWKESRVDMHSDEEEEDDDSDDDDE